MQKTKLTIKHFTGIWIIFFLLFFRPAYYVIGYRLNSYGNYLVDFLCLIMVIAAFHFHRFGYSLNKGHVVIMLLYFWCIIGASVLNSIAGREIDYQDAVYTFLCTLCFALICDIGIWYSPRKTLFAFLAVGIPICTLNAITMFLYGYKGGMNHLVTEQYGRILSENYFFLGEDNATYFWSWPVLVIAWVYYYKFSSQRISRVFFIFYTMITAYSYFYMKSMLAVAASLAVPGVLVLLHRKLNKEKKETQKKKKSVYQFWFLWVAGLVFDYLMSIQVILLYFQPVIEGVFHKDLTLSFRTFIWSRSYLEILNSPIFGYGNEPARITVDKILINHTHNIVLETLYRGGVIGIALLVLMFIVLSLKSNQGETSVLYTFLELMVLVFLICCSVEFAYYRYHYLIIIILMLRPSVIVDPIHKEHRLHIKIKKGSFVV